MKYTKKPIKPYPTGSKILSLFENNYYVIRQLILFIPSREIKILPLSTASPNEKRVSASKYFNEPVKVQGRLLEKKARFTTHNNGFTKGQRSGITQISRLEKVAHSENLYFDRFNEKVAYQCHLKTLSMYIFHRHEGGNHEDL